MHGHEKKKEYQKSVTEAIKSGLINLPDGKWVDCKDGWHDKGSMQT